MLKEIGGEAEHPQNHVEIMRTELARRRFWKACFGCAKFTPDTLNMKKAKRMEMDLTKVEVDGLKPRCDAPLGSKIRQNQTLGFCWSS